MKTKLLKKIRRRAAEEVTIRSVTRDWNDTVTGMRYAYDNPIYRGIFSYGDTEEMVAKRIQHIYWSTVRLYWRNKLRKKKKLTRRQRFILWVLASALVAVYVWGFIAHPHEWFYSLFAAICSIQCFVSTRSLLISEYACKKERETRLQTKRSV